VQIDEETDGRMRVDLRAGPEGCVGQLNNHCVLYKYQLRKKKEKKKKSNMQ
jgi:hypothetical protein